MLEELKAIIKKPILWVTIIGVSLVPMLYNVIFLSSMWDPYGNVDHLPVAVVNQDRSAKLNGKTLQIGQDMVSDMKKTKALDYHFVSKSQAQTGLSQGDYYMVITLPENLSKNATSLLTDHPKKLDIHYQTTKGRSFVASKMSDTAMTKLKETVSKSLTQTYTKSVFKSMGSLRTGMGQAADGGKALADGAASAQAGSKTLSDNLQVLSGATQTLAAGTGTLSNGLGTYVNGVGQVADGLNQLNGNTGKLVDGVSSLASGSQEVGTLASGANQLSGGLAQLTNGTSLSPDQAAQLSQLIQALPALNTAIQGLNTQVSQMTGADQTSPASSSPAAPVDLSGLQGSLETLKTNLTNLSTTTTSSTPATTTTADTSSQLAAVQSTSAYQSLTPEQQAEISGAISANAPQVTNPAAPATSVDTSGLVAQVQAIEDSLSGLSGSTTTDSTGTNPTNSSPLAALSTLQTNLSQLAAQANIVLPGAASSLTSLSSGLSTVNTTLSQQVLPGSQQVAGGISTMQSQLADGSSQLLTGVTSLSGAVSLLANGGNQLTANSGQLLSGAGQLDAGASQLSSGANQLAQGGETLTDGLSTLSSGASTLAGSLMGASKQLNLVSVEPSNAKAVASPVTLSHKDKDKVKTNGVAMAPYMMSVALMVVALSANVIFAKALSDKEPKDRFAWAKNKLLINGLISTAAATILFFAVQLIGVVPNHPLETYLVTLFAAWAFMALVTAFVGCDQRYGSFASLILLLLQLGSSAGTYPIELSPSFFGVIQPYLPMSYSVMGLRKAISMAGDVGGDLRVLLAFTVGAMLLSLVIYRQQDDR